MSEEARKLYEIRDSAPTDHSFIMATFLRGMYYGDSWFSSIPKDIFMASYSSFIENLLKSPGVEIKVACLKDDADVILGYSVLGNGFQTIHWVFVKKAWREQGIARALLPKYPTAVTHLTRLGQSLLTKFKDCIFNPFLL